MAYTIDIDTGGTFTDGFFVGGNRVEMVKVPTTPHDLTVCFLKCIEAGAERLGAAVEDLLYETEIIRFSNTIGTNTIIQRNGAKVGLLVTSGREDLAPKDSGDGKDPLILSEMVVGIEEKISDTGEIINIPAESQILSEGQTLIDRGARCLVVAFANSEFNPSNERLVRRIIKREYPGDFLGSVPVFLSSDISGRSGEQERINAAVLNAYIHAKLVRLLYKAGEELRKRFYHKNLFIVHNNSAVARVARTRAINTYNSGPAAGLLGSSLVGELYGVSSLISADMGGTSFDLGYVRQGRPSYSLRPDVEGFPVNVPMLAIRAIGAGGGSIAYIKNGEVQVGPQSAGALPGPVCFDLGGAEPTVADADLVLGILDPDYFLGGAMKLNKDKAMKVMEEKIAGPMGIAIEQAALEIKNKVDKAMGLETAKLSKKIGSEENPLLVFYGGAGPGHCCEIAQVAGLKKIIITPFSAVFSAFSSSSMDVGHLYYRRVDIALDSNGDLSGLKDVLQDMWAEAERDMRGEGFSSENVSSSLDLFIERANGGPEIKVGADTDFFEYSDKVNDVIREAREVLSGFAESTEERLLLNTVSLMCKATVLHYEVEEIPSGSSDPENARKGERTVFLGPEEGAVEIPVYDRQKLTNGHKITAPALIDSEQTTVFISPGWEMNIDRYNNAVLEEVS